MRRGTRLTAGACAMLLVGILGAAALSGCGGDENGALGASATTRTVTDLMGRKAEVPQVAARVAAVGPGALRLVCYAGAAAQVVGVEAVESQWGAQARPYIMANPELLDLPVIGQGGPDTSPDAEALLNADPDVIFAAYLLDATSADELQVKTGIPVVVLSYGPFASFDEEILESIELVADLTGHADRGAEVVRQLQAWLSDLDERTSGIPDADRPTVYAGAVGMKGAHGIESTQTAFPPFEAINAVNVVDESKAKGSVMIDREQLLEWDPDRIFIDGTGQPMVREDYKKNRGFYRALTAVREGHLYGYLPFNFYVTNVDTAIAVAYFMGTVVYPEAFADVDPAAKADEIYTFLVGAPLYERMAADFGGFRPLDLAR